MARGIDEYFVEEKTSLDKLLDFLVFIAVFVVTIFLILELVGGSGKVDFDMDSLKEIYFYVNLVVFLIFAIDIVRLWVESDGVGDFFKKNWLDVLATIPFGLIAAAAGPSFEILKLAKLSKLTSVSKVSKVSKISKISKEFKAAAHMKKESDEYRKKHRL